MLIAKNDEVKRSKIWRIVTTVTSILIIVIAAFFIIKLFMSNPVEGTWENTDTNLTITIKSGNTVVISIPDLAKDTDVTLKMNYVLDKGGKTITIKENENAILKSAEQSKGQYTEIELKNAVSPITTTFGYSVDGEVLTLTEQDYGEQTIYQRQ